jgi:diadenylate cyclase
VLESLVALIPTEWPLTWALDWRQTLDIALMTFLIYQAYIHLRKTRAARVGAGLAVLGLSYFLAQAAGLFLTSWVLGGIWAATFILVIVIFQTEIRQILEQIQPVIPSFLRRSQSTVETPGFLGTIADTCFVLAKKRCGALLVFERHISLEPLLRSQGVIVDAHISAQLLENVFTPPTPLHDGALYIRDGRVYRASCILPLSETRSLPHFYGTRHRAAVGVTEHCDAVAIVVSEESR